jgi:arginyl-tRNA synthetase
VYQTLTNRLREALAGHIREKYGVELAIVLERPPKIEMGEAASPVCFELAKRLKRAPRQIAQEIANGFGKVTGIAKVEVAGGGYLNAFFDRAAFWESLKLAPEGGRKEPAGMAALRDEKEATEQRKDSQEWLSHKIIVEHTSINPNKAAHIGHVRNAVLGDTMVRILRHAGNRVQIQNYIDNTGVQVADVVIAFQTVKKFRPKQVRELIRTFKHYRQTGSVRIAPLLPRTTLGLSIRRDVRKYQGRLDYYCWDLYARISQILSKDKKAAKKVRGKTLKAIESGKGERAEIAQLVADEIVSAHLQTMARLDIHYDLLARESEILHLKFWNAAFEMLKRSGAIQLATSGKMAGCWIMPWKENAEETSRINTEDTKGPEDAEKNEDTENTQDKIIVRSNGTVTYVGKDIAYQLWKFGLLGKDFHYKKWPNIPEGQTVWATTSDRSDPEAPHFGEAAATVYNVIDARQAYLQKVVAAGLRALGHDKEAERSIHLSYEIVALTPRCAAEMGYELTPEEAKKPYVEVSGRKGFGVKADDLLDKLEAATLAEVQQRHPEMNEAEQKHTAHAIAVGALRFSLLKFTRTAIIAFDFADALSFEGETGPYCQYAVVRIRGIRRKGAEAGATNVEVTNESVSRLLAGAEGNGLWELLVAAGSLDYAVDAAIATQEPAFMAKYAFQLAQSFNNFYHKHHILSEADEQKRAFLLRLTELVEAQLVRALALLGIEGPEKM